MAKETFIKVDYEIHGIEDARIVFIDGIYFMFYAAYDGKTTRGAYAVSGHSRSNSG